MIFFAELHLAGSIAAGGMQPKQQHLDLCHTDNELLTHSQGKLELQLPAVPQNEARLRRLSENDTNCVNVGRARAIWHTWLVLALSGATV